MLIFEQEGIGQGGQDIEFSLRGLLVPIPACIFNFLLKF